MSTNHCSPQKNLQQQICILIKDSLANTPLIVVCWAQKKEKTNMCDLFSLWKRFPWWVGTNRLKDESNWKVRKDLRNRLRLCFSFMGFVNHNKATLYCLLYKEITSAVKFAQLLEAIFHDCIFPLHPGNCSSPCVGVFSAKSPLPFSGEKSRLQTYF